MILWRGFGLGTLMLLGFAGQNAQKPPENQNQRGKPAQTIDVQPGQKQDIKILPRIRPISPIRLGGVFTLGVGKSGDLYENSARNGTKLSEDNARWIAEKCDVVALSPNTIEPKTYPTITQTSPLFTPLLFVYASTLYEKENVKGNVGGWKPEMQAWTLRDKQGKEVKHPDGGGHWMDFGSAKWAQHWRDRVLGLVGQYGAQGVVAAELPIGNTFVSNNLQKYRTERDRAEATYRWLREARAANRFLMIPSALGFDALVGRPVLPVPPSSQQPELSGRFWDEYFPFLDGGWSEGWVRPYWASRALPEKNWEIHLEAADRAARSGQVFIAACAYRNAQELEFGLASYLLASHRQGRFVFQPMPLAGRKRLDAGHSLNIARREILARRAYFDVALGPAMQERHLIPTMGGFVWRRAFYQGAVYVNSSERDTVSITLGGAMRRVSGKRVRKVTLGPQSGVILLFDGAKR